MSANDQYHDWLALIEISGPFLAVPVLKEAFPQGLEELDGLKRKRLRQAYEEWREALEADDPQFAELHTAWIDEVLSRGLELDEDGKGDVLKRADWCAANLSVSLPEHGVALSPDLAVIDEQRANKPLMLIHTYGQDIDLDATLKLDGWAATPADRMVQLCRATGCRLGLVTNGERWMLVDAPVGAVCTFASWYARIWSQEPITLQAFVHLLGIRRFFVDESEQLPALFDRSLKYQDEVTDALGEQVRRAVEVLIQALDKADQDRGRELLRDVKEPELYEAALTVMMRLVFLLTAEERGLLLLGDERYEANYALSTLRMQLRGESEEILERRWDAWSRLLAIFRAVFGGIEHENLRLPALGGSLFDPDRFPFLEGRAKRSDWRIDTAKPLPIDNRTVLLLLEAIQQFQGRTLSYRALDVEQIGYVYEGLLERTVKRTAEVSLELDGTKNAKAPWIKLAELESAHLDGGERLAELLQERSGSSASRVRNDLAKPVDDTLADRLLAACHGDTNLRNRIKPFAHLVRTDPWGYPLVYPAGAFIVTTGSDRRETGTHYTPKSLTEAIVTETLTPIAYLGPAEGTPREQWVLKSATELLDLKICDPAMGSGAFLVQACRWLADRLVEAWSQGEGTGKTVSVDGEILNAPDTVELLPRDTEARTVIARRLIAERCLYGVDLNPLAVELAKLSIWLVTLAKGRPFGFLDHNLRCGDSLLGIHRLDQLTQLSMNPTGQGQLRLFGQNVQRAVREAIELRQQLRAMPIRDIHNVETMVRLDADARQKLEVPEGIADAFIGEVLASGVSGFDVEEAVASLAIHAGQAVNGDADAATSIVRSAKDSLATDLPADKTVRKPFHWPLEFPEVFSRVRPGFDALVGNPPFLGGTKLDGPLGRRYRDFIVAVLAKGKVGVRGAADLCAYFFLRAHALSREHGCIGLIATNSISQGDSREVGIDQIVDSGGSIYQASNDVVWPGSASITVSLVYIFHGEWKADSKLNGRSVTRISSRLDSASEALPEPQILSENARIAFEGAKMIGAGFILSTDEAKELIEREPRNRAVLFPYLIGKDINSTLRHEPSRWAINFFDYSLDRCALDYPDVLRIVEERVKPERLSYPPTSAWNRSLRESWWQYFWRPEMWRVISKLDKVLVRSRVSNMHILVFAPTTWLFSDATTVFAFSDMTSFAVLQSNIHVAWIERQASSMRNDLRYTPSSCFQTFVMPSLQAESAVTSANAFYTFRDQIQTERGCSLRKLYDAINNSNEHSEDLVQLRKMQIEMDSAVASLYGWDPDFLNHGFRRTRHGDRFDISDEARDVVVRRLCHLNAESYSRENPVLRTYDSRLDVKSIQNHDVSQFRLDLQVSEGYAPSNDVATTVLGWLRQQSGWHAKADILAATGITDSQWNAAIADLIVGGRVERQGERRGTRYQAVSTGEEK